MKLLLSDKFGGITLPDDLKKLLKGIEYESSQYAEIVLEYYNQVSTMLTEDQYKGYMNNNVQRGKCLLYNNATGIHIRDWRKSRTEYDGKCQSMTIITVDTTRMWYINEYDGTQSIRYVQGHDSFTNRLYMN